MRSGSSRRNQSARFLCSSSSFAGSHKNVSSARTAGRKEGRKQTNKLGSVRDDENNNNKYNNKRKKVAENNNDKQLYYLSKKKSSSRSKSRSFSSSRRRSISNGRSSKRTYVYSIGFCEFPLFAAVAVRSGEKM